MQRRTLLLGLTALASACTPSLGAFNALAPRDRGVRRILKDAAYGEGPRQLLDVYAPTQGERLPVLVFIYGGSWNSGSKNDYAFAGAAAVRWCVEHVAEYGGDPSRIVLVGHSAGAYTTLMLALDAHYLRDAGVEMSALRGAIGLAGPYDFLPLDTSATREAFGQAPDLQLTQPVHFARADAPPLLLLWGDGDTTVGPRSLRSLENAVRSAGGPVESKIYPGVNHVDIMLALSRPLRGRAPTLEDVATFARRVTA